MPRKRKADIESREEGNIVQEKQRRVSQTARKKEPRDAWPEYFESVRRLLSLEGTVISLLFSCLR